MRCTISFLGATGILASPTLHTTNAATAFSTTSKVLDRNLKSRNHKLKLRPKFMINTDTVDSAHLRFRPPPVLYSLPGSGNTWTRFLIDHMLDLPSGSYYNDIGLHRSFFPGEMTCQLNMSIIKAHPNNFPFDHVFFPNASNFPKKCMEGGINYFDSTILLVREPLRSIWAEYQRVRMQNPHNYNSHTSQIPLSDFNRSHFEHFSLDYARRVVQKTFQITYAQVMENIPQERRIVVHYEDLQNRTTQKKALRTILKFLSDAHFSDNMLEKAFNASEKLHRSNRGITISSQDQATSFETAFTPAFSREVWAILGDALDTFGYPNIHSRGVL